MARMHARRKGKASSHRPPRTENPAWANQNAKEVEELVVKLAGEGMSTSAIGIRLRDAHNVPSIRLLTGKRVNEILAEHKLTRPIPEDLANLIKRAIRINDFLLDNRRDLHNRRNLQLVESKIRRLARYYINKKVLSPDWSYTLENAKLLVE